MKKIASLAFLCMALAACANTIPNVETSLGAAEATALVYVKLPPCSPTSGVACSSLPIVETISDSRKAARIAVDAARKAQTEETLAIAQTAADAFMKIISSDLVQKAVKALAEKGE
jgi:hypothetical protein